MYFTCFSYTAKSPKARKLAKHAAFSVGKGRKDSLRLSYGYTLLHDRFVHFA